MEKNVLLKTSAALVRHAIAIAVLLTRLECTDDDEDEDGVVSDACIARGMALAFITRKTFDTDVDSDASASAEAGADVDVDAAAKVHKVMPESEDKDDDKDKVDDDTDTENTMLDAADLLSQIADLEEAFKRYEPQDGIERHVVEYIRQRLIDTNAGSSSSRL